MFMFAYVAKPTPIVLIQWVSLPTGTTLDPIVAQPASAVQSPDGLRSCPIEKFYAPMALHTMRKSRNATRPAETLRCLPFRPERPAKCRRQFGEAAGLRTSNASHESRVLGSSITWPGLQ